MPRILSKIRQSLLLTGHNSKYLKYAVGEIVLVVIGILIALQINNWNENKKLNVKRQGYYLQLLEDLSKDKVFAKNTIAKFEAQRKAYEDYLNKFSDSNLTIKAMYAHLLKLNGESFGISFNTSTIESLQNSGEIALIPPGLRNRLVDLKRQQEKITKDESLDNRGKTGVTERLSMLVGALSLEKRLEKQEEIKTALNIEKDLSEIIRGLEAVQDWMHFSETKSIKQLNALLKEIDAVEVLIRKKVKD